MVLSENKSIVFVTLVRTGEQRARAGLLVKSLRAFGGEMGQCPIWLFAADPQRTPCQELEDMGVRVLPLNVPETVGGYLFAKKVYACARAEELAGAEVRSLVWLSPDCLIVQPPRLFDLSLSWDAAVRPVHIQNIGLLHTQPVDDFWKKIYETAGVADIQTTVETFVDRQRIRAYFNSHALSVNPAQRLFRRWFECFKSLVCDQAFQAGACQDEIHQIFLHQSILSALIVTVLAPDRIRMLPPTYNYPYNLHESVPVERRAEALNDLVSVVTEDRSLNPNMVDDIHIHEPLKSWLLTHAG